MLNSALRRTLSEASITDIVRDKRDALMADIRDQMIAGAKRFGLAVVDVRIKRADLPAENSEAVFRRMQTERQQRAASYRAQGSQQSQQIKAEADRKVTVITAQAQQQSEQIRGEGDGERNRIFAEAYGADPEFFAFYRSMQAYQNSFGGGRTRDDPRAHQSQVRFLPLFLDAHAPAGNGGRARPRRRRRTEMRDFIVALGLAFAIEGLLMAGFAESMRKRMAAVAREDPNKLRGMGLGAALIGVAIVWASRSLL